MKLHDSDWTLETTIAAAIGACTLIIALAVVSWALLVAVQGLPLVVTLVIGIALVLGIVLAAVKVYLKHRERQTLMDRVGRFIDEVFASTYERSESEN